MHILEVSIKNTGAATEASLNDFKMGVRVPHPLVHTSFTCWWVWFLWEPVLCQRLPFPRSGRQEPNRFGIVCRMLWSLRPRQYQPSCLWLRFVGVNPHCSGSGMVHPTYMREKLLSGSSTTGYMWTNIVEHLFYLKEYGNCYKITLMLFWLLPPVPDGVPQFSI